jgi:hypothetical protein
MNVKNDISEELRSLSALVATISRESPYRAPEGYFLNFPSAVLERVQPGLPRVAGLSSDKPLTFNVPEGYFEGFAQQVLDQIKAGGTGRIKSGESNGSAHSFDGSAPSAGREEEDMIPAILLKAGKGMPYSVPEGYFETLSPILAVAKDKNPYLVPAGYFDGLADEIKDELRKTAAGHRHSKAKVIGFGKPVRWMKYAAAAVVAGLIVTVGWLRWHPGSSSAASQYAKVPAATPAEIAGNLSKVSDAELQSFLVDQDTTLAQPVGNIGLMATAGMDESELVDMTDNGLNSLLGQVPDGELKQYMDEHGGVSDIATN